MILLYRLLYINVNSRIENEPKSQMDENTLSLWASFTNIATAA